MSKMRHSGLRAITIFALLALVLAACGSSSKKGASTSGGSPTTSGAAVQNGGTITIGAEQEPDCMDWLDACSGASWGYWTAQLHTMPFAYRVIPTGDPKDGKYETVPGAVLSGPAKLATSPVQTITYNINPNAVWSDGVPITCDDFAYTVDQEQNGKNLYDTTGYPDIDKVTCPDPKTAVVSYKSGKTYANWKSLFSGNQGIFPSHILKGKDRDALMKDGYTWSGGPWFAKWTKGDNITLTPNPKYWGADKPHVDKVVFKFITDTAAEFNAVKAGQVDAIYPQPQIDVVDQIAAGGLTTLNTAYNSLTGSSEALWMNNAKFPLDSKAVRQALGYAIDRDALVSRLFGKLGVQTASQSLNSYAVQDFSDQQAFSKYKPDPSKVTSLMTGDGWAKGADGIWAKGGKKATIELSTTAGNKRRELTEQVLQQQLKSAGFDVTINNMKAGDLFGEALPQGTFTMAIYAQELTSLAPGLCNLFCSKNIPSAANGNSGQNYTRTNLPNADPVLETGDTSLDDSKRAADAKTADDLLADDVASLPFDPLPDIAIWSKKLEGPIQINTIESMFWNIEAWGIQH